MHTYTHARTHAHTHAPWAHTCTPHAYLLTIYKGVRAFLSQNHQRILGVDDVRIACVPVAHNILRWRNVTLLQRVTPHMQWTRHNDSEKGVGTKWQEPVAWTKWLGQSHRSLWLWLRQSGWDKATGACGCGLGTMVGTKQQELVAWTKWLGQSDRSLWLGQSDRSLWLGQSGWDKATGACGCGLDKVVGTKPQAPVVVA